MRHTSPRRADVATITFPDSPVRVRGWLTHDSERKAYVLTVIPETIETIDGYQIARTTAYSGRRVHVEDAPRFNARRLTELASAAHVHAYVHAFATAYTTSTEE